MKSYVCGLLFAEDRSGVILIEKQRPGWQRGRLNGLGGKINPGEIPHQAMLREALEEADVAPHWELFCTLTSKPGTPEDERVEVHFFRAFDATQFHIARTCTDEKVDAYGVNYGGYSKVEAKLIANLRWLIPLALDKDMATPFTVHFK